MVVRVLNSPPYLLLQCYYVSYTLDVIMQPSQYRPLKIAELSNSPFLLAGSVKLSGDTLWVFSQKIYVDC